jgi:hypothetical protein
MQASRLQVIGACALALGLAEVVDALSHAARLSCFFRCEAVVGTASALGGFGLIRLLPWSKRLLLGLVPLQIATAVWGSLPAPVWSPVRIAAGAVILILQAVLVSVLRGSPRM